jgi:hypothetical protein
MQRKSLWTGLTGLTGKQRAQMENSPFVQGKTDLNALRGYFSIL